jgi:hypothetical protein
LEDILASIRLCIVSLVNQSPVNSGIKTPMTSKLKKIKYKAPGNTWHKCLGCDGTIGLLPNGIPGWEPPGAVMHTKPKEHANKVRVQCPLWLQSTAQQITDLHKDTPQVVQPEEVSLMPIIN